MYRPPVLAVYCSPVPDGRPVSSPNKAVPASPTGPYPTMRNGRPYNRE